MMCHSRKAAVSNNKKHKTEQNKSEKKSVYHLDSTKQDTGKVSDQLVTGGQNNDSKWLFVWQCMYRSEFETAFQVLWVHFADSNSQDNTSLQEYSSIFLCGIYISDCLLHTSDKYLSIGTSYSFRWLCPVKYVKSKFEC